MKSKYYSIKPLMKKEPNAQYYMIIGERSNGKTFSVEELIIDNFFNNGSQGAIVRRWQEDIRGKRGASMFEHFINNPIYGNLIEKKSKGKWNAIRYRSRSWYMARVEGEEITEDSIPFCYAFALSDMEHDKSTSYPLVQTILFDEFTTRGMYLDNEFITFMNVLSTIIRDRNNVKIFMCGNTVNKYSPYFTEMGLRNISKMTIGAVDIYTYGDSSLRVAVEFSDNPQKEKASNVYFAFDNPRLSMITGKGQVWEIDIYPHLTRDYKFLPKNVKLTFYVVFNREILECKIVHLKDDWFMFIHAKTTEIKEDNKNLVYDVESNPKKNYRTYINRPSSILEKRIFEFIRTGKVFYSTNEVGEVMRNYLLYCGAVK